MLKMFSPFIIFSFFLISKFTYQKIFKDTKAVLPFESNGHISLMTMLISSLYTLLMAGAVSPLMCVNLGNGKFPLISSPSIYCFESTWSQYAVFIFMFLVIYGAAFPAFIGYQLYKNRHNIASEKFTREFGHLTSPYKDKHFYWELIAMAKRSSFAVISQVVPLYSKDNMMLYFLTVMLLFFFLYLEYVAFPFKRKAIGVKSFTWTIVIVLLLICDGFVFKSTMDQSKKNQFAVVMILFLCMLFLGTITNWAFEARTTIKQINTLNNTNPRSELTIVTDSTTAMSIEVQATLASINSPSAKHS
jgi:hypothetical protein